MGTRGGVHVFFPSWTEPGQDGKRITKWSKNPHWRFTFAGKRFSCGLGIDGHPFKTKTAARDAGEARLAEVRQGYEQDPRKATWKTLETIIRSHCKGEDPATAASMEACLSRLRGFFGNDRLRDLDDTRIIQFKDRQLAPGAKTETEGYQPSTVKLDLSYLGRGLAIAFRKRLVLELPSMPTIRRRKRTNTVREDELPLLIAGMPEHWRRFFLIADELGWRARSELRTRQWQHVSFVGGWVHLDAESSKTREARVFPFTARLRALLEDQREWVSGVEQRTARVVPWVCPREDGRQLGGYGKVWKTACKRAGFGKIEGRTGPWSSVKVAHDIRRAAQNRWENIGVGSGVRQAMSGHSSPSTFHDYYEVTSLDDLKRAAERIDAAREAAVDPKVVSIAAGKKD